MTSRLIFTVTLFLQGFFSMPMRAETPRPPIAAVIPKKLEAHGHLRIDNYHWMRERDNPQVIEYLKSENNFLEAVLASVRPLRNELYDEIVGRIKQDDTSVPYAENGYEYYRRYEEGGQYPIYCRRALTEDAGEQIMLDVNQLAKGHTFCSVGAVRVNRQNRLAAFAIDTVGRRIYSLRVKDLASGEILDEEIKSVTGNYTWAEDGATLFYTKQDPQTLRSYRVFRHRLGTDPKQDALVFEETDETFSCYVSKTRSKKYILINSTQTLSSECRFLDAQNPLGEFQIVEPRRRDHEYSVNHIGDTFYIRTNDKARNFRLMKTSEEATSRENWQEVIPHRNTILLERFSLFQDYLVVQDRRDGLSRLRIMPWDGSAEHELDFGEPAYFAFSTPTPEANTSVLRYRYTSLTTPWSTFDYDMENRTKTLRKQDPVLGDFDPRNYVTERLSATARDGTAVPVSVVFRKGTRRAGHAPCLLDGYGSYGITNDPMFQSSLLSLLDRGFVYAIAHIRGGQMLGRQWYEDGKLLKKKNTFTDFIDCGEFLIEEGLADPKRLYAVGGSAGGLLMGAVINMRPDLFDGVVAHVPFVDVLTTMLDDSIPLTTSEYDEWGNPHEKKYYDYILSYSPYDNIVAMDYPNLLVTSGLHDSQVQYWEPTKWVAKLRALKTDDNLLLLKTNMEAGHGGASGRFERYKLVALEYAFLLQLAGLDKVDSAGPAIK